MNIFKILFIFLLFNYSINLLAQQIKLYNSARSIARGNAVGADIDDYSAMFINPAGIPLLPKNLFNAEIQLETSMGLNDFLTAHFGDDTTGRIQSEDELNKFRGKNTRAKMGILGSYVRNDFAFAFLTNTIIDSDHDDKTPPNVNLFSTTDIALQISYGKAFFQDNSFRVGGSAKIVYRLGRFGIKDFDDLYENAIIPTGELTQEGLALGMDLGTQYTWKKQTYDISVGLAFIDLVTPFGINLNLLQSSEGRPPSLPARFDLGTGIKFHNIGKKIQLRTNIDIIKSVTTQEVSLIDIFHFGTEIIFPQFLSLRAGLNQSYWTAGAGIKYWLLNVDFATYVDDTGIYSTEKRPSDRRYLFQFKLYI